MHETCTCHCTPPLLITYFTLPNTTQHYKMDDTVSAPVRNDINDNNNNNNNNQLNNEKSNNTAAQSNKIVEGIVVMGCLVMTSYDLP